MNRSNVNKAVIAASTLALVLVTVSLFTDEWIQIPKEAGFNRVRTRFGARLLDYHYRALEYERGEKFVRIFTVTSFALYLIWISNLALLGYASASLLLLSDKKWAMLPSLVLSSLMVLASLFTLIYYPASIHAWYRGKYGEYDDAHDHIDDVHFGYSFFLTLPSFIFSAVAAAAAAVGHFVAKQ